MPEVAPPPDAAPSTVRVLPPILPGQQGIFGAKTAPMDRFADALVHEPGIGMAVTYRADDGVYEARSATGDVRFQRTIDDNTGQIAYPIVSLTGTNPLANTSFTALPTLADQNAAAGGPNKPVPNGATTYPDPYRRIAQLFDSPRAPDLAYSQSPGADPNHPGGGTHGNLDLIQSRAPLIVSGPGIAAGVTTNTVAHVEDIAPTIAEALGVKKVTGYGPDGKLHPDQWLKWQDGSSLLPSISAAQDAADGATPAASTTTAAGQAQRAVIFVLDGMNQAVLQDAIQRGLVPNIARIAGAGTTFRYGQMADFPTVTFVNHNSILSGAEPGHTGIVNNSWYERSDDSVHVMVHEPSNPDATEDDAVPGSTSGSGAGSVTQAPPMTLTSSLHTSKYLSPLVETLYEAVDRSFPGARTMSLNDPSGRGASVSTLDTKGIGTLALHLPQIAWNLLQGWRHVSDPARKAIKANHSVELQDDLADSIGISLLNSSKPPKLSVFELETTDHQGHLEGPQNDDEIKALQESDRNIGRVLDTLDKRGLFNDTMFVVTADHGMEPCTPDQSYGVTDAANQAGVHVLDAAPFIYMLGDGSAAKSSKRPQGLVGGV